MGLFKSSRFGPSTRTWLGEGFSRSFSAEVSGLLTSDWSAIPRELCIWFSEIGSVTARIMK